MIKKYNSFLINEGRYDSLVREVVNDIMDFFKNSKPEQKVGEHGVGQTFEAILPPGKPNYGENHNMTFEVKVELDRIPDLFDGSKHVDFIVQSFRITEKDRLEFIIFINPNKEPQLYEDIFMKLQEDVRHEMEHLLQYGTNRRDDRPGPTFIQTTDMHDHHLYDDEIPALVQGFYRKAKLQKTPLIDVMIDDLVDEIDSAHLTEDEADEILNKWVEWAKANLPKAII